MTDSEHTIQSRILALGRGACRLFRVNAGRAWTGNGRKIPPGVRTVSGPGIWIPDGRLIRLAPPGSPDIVGAVAVGITADMVGQTVAIAVGIEVKSARGTATAKQIAALKTIGSMGGRAGVARSVEEAERIINAE